MLVVTTVSEKQELEQIYQLNLLNLKKNVAPETASREGFVTWLYSMKLLEQMHAFAPSIIIKDKDQVVAYALTTLPECAPFHKDLQLMIDHLQRLCFGNTPVTSLHFYCMGQICIHKNYRGKGLVNMLYKKHKELYRAKYDLLITEISTSNKRSIQAHSKIGFEVIDTYQDSIDEWNVVAWNWK